MCLCLWVLAEVREKPSKLIQYKQSQCQCNHLPVLWHHQDSNPLTISNSSLLIVMQVGKQLTAPVVVKHVLKMKSSQFLKLVLMPEHHLCAQFCKQRIEFTPTPFIHTPYWNLTDAIFDFKTLYLEHKTLVFSLFTLIPLSSSTSFQFFDLTLSSLIDSATVIRSLVYNSSYGQPVLNLRDRAFTTITKRSGLTTDPWCTLSEKLIGLL